MPFLVSRVRIITMEIINTEDYFKKAFFKHNAIMLIIEPNTGAILYANQAAENFYGYSIEQLLTMHIQQINTLTQEEIAFERQNAIIENRNYFIFSHRLANDEIHTVEVHASPIFYQGKIALFSIIHDITIRKMAENWLSHYNQVLEKIMRGVELSEILTDIVLFVECQYARGICSILLLTEQNTLELGAAPNLAKHYNQAIHGLKIGPGVGSCGTAAYTKKTVIVEDIMTHSYWQPYREIARSAGLFSCWSEPILDKSTNVLGTFAIYHNTTCSPTTDSMTNIKKSAHLAAIAIEHSHHQKKLYYMAHYDTLTGLPNRVLLKEKLDTFIRKAAKKKRKLAVFFIDLDRFKNINDTLGHPIGDRLLKQIAKIFQKKLEGIQTIISRVGGDEFIVLVKEGRAGWIRNTVRKLMSINEQSIKIDNYELYLSVSIGISVYPLDGMEAEELLKHADLAMYFSKKMGRNRFNFFKNKMTESYFKNLYIEHSLKNAIDKNELSLYYQPKVDIPSQKIIGVEALSRWFHPDLGSIPPYQFIPLAEDMGLIGILGKWVLQEACQQITIWDSQNIFIPRIAINLSVWQIESDSFVEKVADVLKEFSIAPNRLEFEVTESMLMQEKERSTEVLNEFQKMGIRISVDDFGTGYSSLGYLKHLPVYCLKIDKSFVRDIETDRSDRAIAIGIINLARSLNLDVVAEGIETKEQEKILLNEGCQTGQGYLYSHPLPPEQFLANI